MPTTNRAMPVVMPTLETGPSGILVPPIGLWMAMWMRFAEQPSTQSD